MTRPRARGQAKDLGWLTSARAPNLFRFLTYTNGQLLRVHGRCTCVVGAVQSRGRRSSLCSDCGRERCWALRADGRRQYRDVVAFLKRATNERTRRNCCHSQSERAGTGMNDLRRCRMPPPQRRSSSIPPALPIPHHSIPSRSLPRSLSPSLGRVGLLPSSSVTAGHVTCRVIGSFPRPRN